MLMKSNLENIQPDAKKPGTNRSNAQSREFHLNS